jgi:hypothetical protein
MVSRNRISDLLTRPWKDDPMTPLCSHCHNEPVLPGRTIDAICHREQRRERARAEAQLKMKAHRASPPPMTVEEFEAQWEAVEGMRKVKE